MIDKLNELFNKQRNLQETIGSFPITNDVDKQQFINLNILACLDELSEILRETAWKNPNYVKFGWKTKQVLNEEKFQEEIVDLWHFLINLTMISGMDAEELFDRYTNKNKVNHERQKTGY